MYTKYPHRLCGPHIQPVPVILSVEVHRAHRKIDQSPPPGSVVWNIRNFISTTPLRFHDMHTLSDNCNINLNGVLYTVCTK